jgi:hypothetical protein
MSFGEKTLLLQLLKETKTENSILLLDRGFGHFCTIAELINQEQLFCVRLPIKNSNFAMNMIKQDESDKIVEWYPSKKEKENCLANNLACRPIKVRVVKVTLSTGETELLVTNLLNQAKYSALEISELYHLRWKVEEGYKNLKPKMKIEHFGCRKTEGVYQEFFDHVFIINMVALAGLEANRIIEAKTKHRKHKYTYNWKNGYRFLRENILQLLKEEDGGNVLKLLNRLINQIAGSTIAIKPNRSFVRDLKHKNKKGRITQFNK